MPPIHVLYVDDEEELLEVGKFYLELNDDLRIITVASAKAALAELSKGKFEAVVADYQMPEMNGIELLKEIRAKSPMPFILFTGKGREEVVIEALNSGADFYLQKGGDLRAQFAELEHKIKEAVRKRWTEQALDESEVKFRKVFNNSNDAIFIINSEGRFIDVNTVACRELGYSKDELLRLSPFEITRPDISMNVDRHIRETIEKGSLVFETAHMTKEGAEIPVELTTQLFIHEGKGAIMGVARDISERKRAEEALRASEERFRVLFETANDGILLMDDFTFIECNSKALELYGCSSKQELIGHTPYEFSPERQPDGSDSRTAAIQRVRAAREGHPQRFNWQHLRHDGTPFHVEVALSTFTLRGQKYVEAIVRDITSKMRMEGEVNRTNESLSALINATNDIAFLADMDQRFVLVNDALSDRLHIAKAEMVGKDMYDFLPPEVQETRRARVLAAIATGGRQEFMDSWGGDIFMNTINPILGLDGEMERLAVFSKNMTDVVKAQEDFRESEAIFKCFIEQAMDAVFITDEEGVIIECNPKALELVGMHRDEVIGKSAWGTMCAMLPEENRSPEYLGQTQTTWKKLFQTGGDLGENRVQDIKFKRKDGSTGYIQHMMFPIQTDQGWRIGISVRDVTEAKSVQQILVERQHFMDKVLSSTPTSIFVFDIKEDRVVFANSNPQNPNKVWIEGIGKVAQISSSVVHPEDQAGFIKVMARLASAPDGDVLEYEFRVVFPGTEPLWIRTYSTPFSRGPDGRVKEILSSALVIKESKDAELKAKDSERRFQMIAENTQDVIWKMDVRSMRFTYISPSVISLRGLTVEEAMGQSLQESVDPVSYDMITRLFPLRIQQLKDGREEARSRTDVVQQRRKDGSWATVEVVTTLLTDGSHEVVEMLGVSRDATDRKKAEAIQSALYRIAHATNSTISLEEIFSSIHGTLKDLIPAQNFFISLFDEGSNLLSYPYFIDDYDDVPASHTPDKGLTSYVLRTGQPLLASPEVFEALVRKGEVDPLGAPSVDWVGVPLRIAGRIIGVMVIQSYAEGIRLSESDQQVMEFISDQVAMAIERKEAEAAQLRAQEALRSANKKLSLLSSITRHDILNQVAALKGYLDLSRMSLDDPVKLRGYLEKERAAALTIEHHISFTKDYEDMGMNSPCWQNLELVFRKATKQLPVGKVRLEIDTGGLEVYADPLLEKAFYNLVDNSLKYGGHHLNCIKVTARGGDPDLVIVYQDDGVGIEEVDKANLFHYGFGKHTGLGLFLSREILSITGLTIRENGHPGQGAKFEMTVPEGAFRGSRPPAEEPRS